MNFLYPLFLAGAFAVVLPIVFHLIRRSTKDKVPFSTLRFLEPTPPRLTKKSRLEHLWLLLLRCLILLLLAAAFARPYIERAIDPTAAIENPQRNLILVDTSASMQRSGAWDQAKSTVGDVLNDIDTRALAAAYTFNTQLSPLVTFEQWNNAPNADRPVQIVNRLNQAEPTWKATHLGNALLTAVDLLEDSTRIGDNNRDNQDWRIIVVGDLQTGMQLDGIQGFEWPKGCQVVFHPIEVDGKTNVGIHSVPNISTYASLLEDESGRVRVSNAGESESETFSFGWVAAADNPQLTTATEIYLPPGKSRVVTVPSEPESFPADILNIQGDDHDFDNTAWRVPQRARESSVVYLGTPAQNQTEQLNFYLEKAFQQTRRHVVTVTTLPPDQPILDSALEEARLLVVGAPLTQAVADQVARANAEGHTVLLPLHRTELQATLQAVVADPSLTLNEDQTDRYALFGEVDFQHPVFTSFADPRFSDFSKIHFWDHIHLDIEGHETARVLAKFDNQRPAIIQFPRSQGSVFVTAFGWQPKLSQFALSTKFVPFLYALLDFGAGIHEVKSHYFVGQDVDLSSLTDRNNLSVTLPDGSTQELEADNAVFRGTDQPGIYTLRSDQSAIRFAVNLHPAESLTAPILEETLMGLEIPMDLSANDEAVNPIVAEAERKLKAAEIESNQKYWRWMVMIALVIATLETFFAGRLSRNAVASA